MRNLCTFSTVSQFATRAAELQKALNLPPGKIFKVCKSSSKCCKIGLSKLKIRINLENESLFFCERRNDFWNRLSFFNFFVMLVFMIHYVVRADMKPCSFFKPSSRIIPAYPRLLCNSDACGVNCLTTYQQHVLALLLPKLQRN